MTHTIPCKLCGSPTERVNRVPATCFNCKKERQTAYQREYVEKKRKEIIKENSKV